jgi:hypothetical protein
LSVFRGEIKKDHGSHRDFDHNDNIIRLRFTVIRDISLVKEKSEENSKYFSP